MSFIQDSIREALNESLEVISQFGNKTLLLADEFDGKTYMVMDDYIDENNPGNLDRSFISKDEALHYLMTSAHKRNIEEDAVCDRCGAPIEGDGFNSTTGPNGILCDACYYDMYGVNEGLENGPNKTSWEMMVDRWFPTTYQDGYESLRGLDIPEDVWAYMDEWFGFETIIGQTPDGQIMLADEDGNYELYDTVDDFVVDIRYAMDQTHELDESVIPATDVVVRNASGELSRQAVSSTEELGKYLVSMVDALEAGDTISLETIDFMESLNKLVESLNEDANSEDNALIRSAYKKIDGKQSNMRLLTQEEKDALKRNGIDAWAWDKETKMVSPSNNDIISGRKDDKYYYMRNGHYKKDLDIDKVNLVDRAAKMDARDANQDIKAGPRDNYQVMNRRYDDNKMQEPVYKMKSALRRRNDAQAELDNAEADFREREIKNAAKHSQDIHDSEITYAKTDRELSRRLDDNSAKIQAILDRHKRESLELIEYFLSDLNEAEMSDEDKRDTELIRSAQMKLSKRSNAKLSDDELAALERHNLIPFRNGLIMDNGNSRYLPNDDKANLARMADKRPERLKYNTELYNADFSDSADRNEKNYSKKYSWERTQQDKERALDAARMGKDYDEMDRLVRDKRYIKNKISDNDAERLANLKIANSRRDTETERNKARLMRIKDENPAKIAAAQAEINSLLRKNESLHGVSDEDFLEIFEIKYSSFASHCARAFGVDSIYDLSVDEVIDWLEKSGYKDISDDVLSSSKGLLSESVNKESKRVIPTDLENNKINNEILRSVIGQMSDGIWENSPGMDRYWYPLEIDGTNIVIDNSKYNTYDEMSDSEVKRFFANKIKRIAQEFLNDNNMNPFNGFAKDNATICNYLNYEEPVTVGDAYKACEKLK